MANRTHSSKEKLTQAEYRRHIFDKSRGRKGGASIRADLIYGDQPWYKPDRSLGELYEQENSVKNWGNLDSTDRKNYRKAELDIVKRRIAESVSKHPGVKGRDKALVDDIVKAYVDGKDLSSVTNMPEEDRKDWETILEESTSNAIEGTALPSRWKSSKETGSQDGTQQGGTQQGGTQQGGTLKNGTLKNGTLKNGNPQQPAGTGARQPLTPRDTDVSTTGKYDRVDASDTGVRVDGALLQQGNTVGKNNLQRVQNADLAAEAIVAEEGRRDAQNNARSGARIREQNYNETQYELDKRGKALRDQRAADRQTEAEARQAARVKDRKLVNAADWDALGKEANADNYDVNEAGIDEKEKARRQSLVDKRNERIAALRERLAAATDKTLIGDDETAVRVKGEDGKYVTQVYKTKDIEGRTPLENGAYAGVSVPAEELQERAKRHTGINSDWHYSGNVSNNAYKLSAGLANLDKHIQEGIKNGTLTDAQIEAAEKNLDSATRKADSSKAHTDAMAAWNKATKVAKLRQQYGMTDRSNFTDDEVIEFHKGKQNEARLGILKDAFGSEGSALGLMEGSTLSTNAGVDKFTRTWQSLIDNGLDIDRTEKAALSDPATKAAYTAAIRGLDPSDKDFGAKKDAIRQRLILNQAYKDAGGELLGDPNRDLGSALPGRERYVRGAENRNAEKQFGDIVTPETLDADRKRLEQTLDSVNEEASAQTSGGTDGNVGAVATAGSTSPLTPRPSAKNDKGAFNQFMGGVSSVLDEALSAKPPDVGRSARPAPNYDATGSTALNPRKEGGRR